MSLEQLIDELRKIHAVHPYADVKVGVPDVGVRPDSKQELMEVHYDHLGRAAIIEL